MSKQNGSNTALKKPDSDDNGSGLIVMKDLEALGLDDIDLDLQEMTKGFQLQPPRIRIEHSNSGRHRMFIDYGDSYSEDDQGQLDVPGNKLSGVVVYAQKIRALWKENESLPTCAAIDDFPTVNEPVNGSCIGCRENRIGSTCKPKVRLLVMTWVSGQPELVLFPLSPTSIKRWKTHVSKLARSKAPYIAVVTRFTLDDTQKNAYRWAEVSMSVDRVVSKQELESAIKVRDQFKQQLGDVNDEDYSDPGDKVPF